MEDMSAERMQAGQRQDPEPSPWRSNISVEEVTEATFRGVMRAIAVRRADPEPSPWRQNPILIYGIIALPQELGQNLVQQPGIAGPGIIAGEG